MYTELKTFLLINYTPGLEKLFDIGKELVIYESIEDLDSKVKYYLENEDERNKISETGYQRVKKYHTYFERAKKLINIIDQMITFLNLISYHCLFLKAVNCSYQYL